MKGLTTTTALLSLAAAVAAGPLSARQSSFASVDGLKFRVDGATNYLAGTNSFWIPFLTDDAELEQAMSNIASSGLKLLRIWGFNDVNTRPAPGTVWFQLLTPDGAEINTGPDGLQRLDAVVAAAERHGVKLIVPLVNNWANFGGMQAYAAAFGGDQKSWYTNPRCQDAYRAYVAAVVARYRDSPAIFTWQLANEPRCQQCDMDVVHDWAAETSRFVKSLDPNHMVSLGEEGMGLPSSTGYAYPYSYYEGMDFIKNLAIPDLDFATVHWYPNQWNMQYNDTARWVQDHVDACRAAGKPCLFEEYGSLSDHCAVVPSWQTDCLGMKDQGLGGDAFWQWGETFASTGPTPNDGYTVYVGSSQQKCMVTDHVNAIKAAS